MKKRFIRLKELGVNMNTIYTPNQEYLERCPKLESGRSYLVQTDNEGNQLTSINNQSANKVFLIGASTIESVYLDESKRPHSLLEIEMLSKGIDCSVKNLGVSGTHTLNIINLIVSKLGLYSNSTVVITIPSNELSTLAFDNSYWNYSKYFSTIIDPNVIEKEPQKFDLRNIDFFIRNLLVIKEICNLFKLKLFFTTVLFWKDIAAAKELNVRLRQICQEYSINLIDLEADFLNQSDYFYDGLHFLESGSRKFASLVGNALAQGFKSKETSLLKKVALYAEKKKIDDSFNERLVLDIKNAKKIILTVDYEKTPSASKEILISLFLDSKAKIYNSAYYKSISEKVGWYTYIPSYESEKLEVSYEIPLPEHSNTIAISLLRWKEGGVVEINKADIYLVF